MSTDPLVEHKPLRMLGWQEWAWLPTLADAPVRAKIDTGAASSSVHASNVVMSTNDNGRQTARFDLHLDEDRSTSIAISDCLLKGTRSVRSSSGHWEMRPVVRLPLRLENSRSKPIVTLASRDPMEYRMLIGRAALNNRFCIDPSQSFLLGEPQ